MSIMVYCPVKPCQIYPSFVPILSVASLNFKLRLGLNWWHRIIIENTWLLLNIIFRAIRIFLRQMVVRVCVFINILYELGPEWFRSSNMRWDGNKRDLGWVVDGFYLALSSWMTVPICIIYIYIHLHNFSKNKYVYTIYTQIIYFHYSIDIYLDH